MSTKLFTFHLTILCLAASLLSVSNLFGQPVKLPVIKEVEKTLEKIEESGPRKRLPEIEAIGTPHVGISFDEIWQTALQHNPSIRQKQNLIAAAQGARQQAGLYPNPNMTYAGDNLGVDSGAGKHGLGVWQEFVTADKKRLDRNIAGYDIAVARQEYDMECRKLYNDLQIAFACMLHAQIAVQIERYSESLSDELLQAAIQLQKEGKKKSIDVLQFRTNVKESGLQVRLAEHNQRKAWRELITVIGCTDWPQQAVRGSLTENRQPRNWDATWAALRADSPQLDVACLRARQAQANLARQTVERVPNVTAGFSVAQDVTAKNTVPFVSVSVPLKVFDRNQGNIRKARAELASANREVERVLLSLHAELAEVFCTFQSAQESVLTYETEILPDTFKALHELNDLYHQGTIDYLELYTQRHDVLSTLLRYNDALKDQAVSATLIDGMLLKGTIKR